MAVAVPIPPDAAGDHWQSRAFDLLCAAPLWLFYALVIAVLVPVLAREWHRPQWTATDIATFASQLASLAMMLLIMVLLVIRRVPVRKARGFVPRFAATLASNIQFGLLLLPRRAVSPPVALTAAVLTTAGLLLAITALLHLGRCFAILPQARGFVRSGPYAVIRHPVYAGEIVAAFGTALLFAQPWAITIAVVALALQLWRMDFEEQVLTAADPRYASYMRHSFRLVPGLY
jgi:protein-S-isoprenylcysteine O-methyltransferase Ste14